MTDKKPKTGEIPGQKQSRQPGIEAEMTPRPLYDDPEYKAAGKLEGKTALITGGDSGIGRAVAVLYAREGADVAISYLDEHEDANETRTQVEKYGRRCLLLPGNIGREAHCRTLVDAVVKEFGRVDILVNNAAIQFQEDGFDSLNEDRLHSVFSTNVFSMFYLITACLPHMREGSSIINTTSIVAYRGNPHLFSYASSKGAILALTRSLVEPLLEKGIRINAVAPGPIWTPLIPATFDPDHVEQFGGSVPMKRPGQPVEVATCYVFLASKDAAYISGQVLHPNGGMVVNA